MIEVQNLSKSYQGNNVLENINVKFERGGITAIVGGNGAGKSTLLSIISQLEEADTGHALFDGQNIGSISRELLAKHLSILRQDNHLVGRLTVRDLVSFGRYPYSKGRLTQEDHNHVDTALRFLDLETLQHRYLDALSGGQRQRAFVAMVMCQDTDYVLLDEPLNNLDMKHSVAMMKMIRRLADEQNRTILIVIHDINFAAAYADRILALKQGKLICHDCPKTIMNSKTLELIFDTPVKVEEHDGRPLAVYYR
ncbi:MAG: ATP-binding cassette domain-containing protein [Pseudomonadota bacterium]|nr:ATP-binding cassette domain-containing protein [Pseudomonadota bacterium]